MKKSLGILAEMSFHNYTYPLEVLARHPETPRAIVDYRDLVARPRATLEQAYAELGLVVSPELAAALDAEEQRAGGHETTHAYSLDEFGLDGGEIQRRLGALFERFGWEGAPPGEPVRAEPQPEK